MDKILYSTSFNHFYKHYDADKAFEAMRKIGYRACDIGLDLRKAVSDKTNQERVALLRSLPPLAKKHGISIGQTHGSFFFDTDTYEEEYIREYIRLKKEEILITAALDCKYMVVHPLFFSGWQPNTERTRAKQKNIEILSALCAFAEDHGVFIALENMPGCKDYNRPCSSAEDLAEHIRGVSSPNICACLDFGHANISIHNSVAPCETSLSHYIEILGRYIQRLHVHDNLGNSDLHALPLSPHFGGIDWKEAIDALKKASYTGTFNAEIDFSARYPASLFLKCEELQFAILQEIAKPLL